MNSTPATRARHVAIIMDGNGRWAKQRHLPRVVGHQRGVEAVRTLVRSLAESDLECLTLYAFSSENWKRPEDEVSDLMNLMRRFIRSDLDEFIAQKDDLSGADIKAICSEAGLRALRERRMRVNMADFRSAKESVMKTKNEGEPEGLYL